MLIAAGPGVMNLKDYTNATEMSSITVTLNQGDTLPTAKCQIWDPKSIATVTAEVDFVVLDEYDPNGWPTSNLVANPSFAGPYTGGVAASWAAMTTGAGITMAQGTNFIYGTTSQKFTLANAASGINVGVSQSITLPKDELQNVIRSQPYTLSFWLLATTAATNATITIEIDWYTAGSGYLSSVTANPTPTTGIWRRYAISGTPPPTAAIGIIYALYHTTSATNAGSLTVACAQFEANTFAAYQSVAFNPYYENLTMAYHGTAGVVDGWLQNTVSGATFTGDTTTYLQGGFSQKIVVTNIANAASANIQQSAAFSPYGVYTISLTYLIPSALTGCSVSLNVQFYDGGGGLLTSPAKVLASTVPTGVWNSLSLRIGPGTGNVSGLTGTTIQIQVGIDAQSGTNSGTVYLGIVAVNADPIAKQVGNAAISAAQAGRYPTSYCDSFQAGCYVDTDISNLAYRHLRFFGGYIRSAGFDYTQSMERTIDVDAVGYGIILQESPANLIIRNVTDSAAIALAVTYAKSQGFLAGLNYTTYVQTVSTVDSLTFNWQSTKDVLTQIANLTVADYWVDEYKFLHYQAALATPGPYGFSDTPNNSSTFQMFGFKFDNDSTQSITTKIFEGGTIVSLPVAQTFHGVATTLNAGLTSGTVYTSITVVATTTAVQANTLITINNGTTTQILTVSTDAISGATALLCVSFTANANYVATNTVVAYGFVVNSGVAIYQVTSATVNGVAQTVGVSGVNTLATYQSIVDATAATLTFATAPPNTQAVVITYTYQANVIVRLRNGGAETIYGSIRRRINHHQQDNTVTSITTAIVRGQSELYQYSKARPIGRIKAIAPPNPVAVHLRPGMYVPVTYVASGLSASPFQIQRATITQLGPGVVQYELDVGFYRVDLAMLVYQGRQHQISTQVDAQGAILTDVLSVNDGWAMTDAIAVPTIVNVGAWAPPTVSVWDDTAHAWS